MSFEHTTPDIIVSCVRNTYELVLRYSLFLFESFIIMITIIILTIIIIKTIRTIVYFILMY